jgi:hypothetical protein
VGFCVIFGFIFSVGRSLVMLNNTRQSSSMTNSWLINESTYSTEKDSLNMVVPMRTNLKLSRNYKYVLIIVDPKQVHDAMLEEKNVIGIIVECYSKVFEALKDYKLKPVWAVTDADHSTLITLAEKKGFVSICDSIAYGELNNL